jgi:hypothetical protein
MKSLKKYYRVDRPKIAFMKFIIEAYDGVGLLSTVDSDSGLVVLHIPPGREAEIDAIIADLKNDILIEPAERPSEPGDRKSGSSHADGCTG